MQCEHLKITSVGIVNYDLNGVIWKPDNRPVKHVIHIVHGMTEHIGRYEKFAETITPMGIAVAGFDLRGHGHNASSECASFISGGNPETHDYGWAKAIDDIQRESIEIQRHFPSAKHYLLGFSLGASLVQDYMRNMPMNGIDGVILVGTGYQPPIVTNLLSKVIAGEIKKTTPGMTTKLTRELAFGTYNKQIPNAKTSMDWLCSDEQQLAEYMNDTYCRHDLSADLFFELLCSMSRTNSKQGYMGVNDLTDMPILLISGKNDAVGDMGRSISKIARRMRKSGIKNVEPIIINNARHDVFHEHATGGDSATTLAILNWVGV